MDHDRLQPLSHPQTNIFLVCFPVVSPSSFENVKEKQGPEIAHDCPKTPFMFVGTQTDLRDIPSSIGKLAKNRQKPITEGLLTSWPRIGRPVSKGSAFTQKHLRNRVIEHSWLSCSLRIQVCAATQGLSSAFPHSRCCHHTKGNV